MWGWGTPLKRRPPPGVTSVPKPVPVVKPLARLADLVTVTPTAHHAINIEVGYGTGANSHAFALYGVRRQGDAPRTPGGAAEPNAASVGGGSGMVLRRAKTGQHAGREFWGCSMFAKTKCGGVREVE